MLDLVKTHLVSPALDWKGLCKESFSELLRSISGHNTDTLWYFQQEEDSESNGKTRNRAFYSLPELDRVCGCQIKPKATGAPGSVKHPTLGLSLGLDLRVAEFKPCPEWSLLRKKKKPVKFQIDKE